ncbi:craniofacial development protein 2-like [Artemia franciscana]|uniref:craniofacial development protein 2-like n=1 Tax=Artemia franciscana TaxID=6661 RepID=UPI0032DAC4EB
MEVILKNTTPYGEADEEATAYGETDEHATAYGEADDHNRPMTTPGRDADTLQLISTKTVLNIGTLNTQTLAKPGKMDLLLRELNQYKWDLVGLNETHLPRTGEETISGTSLLLSGRTDGTHRQGVGFILSPTKKKTLISFTPVSERIATIRLKGSVSNLTIIQVYAPDSARSDE